jgi:hypothetical protein
MIQYADGHWGKPVIVAEQFLSPTFSIDGQTLYMRKGGMSKRLAVAQKRRCLEHSRSLPRRAIRRL